MFENDAKGWHGSYSISGRNSAEKYHLIIHKDEILKNELKKYRVKDVFSPDDSIPLETLEENLNIFKVYEDQKNLLSMNKKEKINSKTKKISSDNKYKYHNQHMKEGNRKKKKKTPETKYYPKYEYIYPKLITGPSWKYLKGRDDNNNNVKKIDEKDFYLDNNINTNSNSSKCLVNMDKTTQRGDFNVSHDIRIRNDKPFNKNYLTCKSDNYNKKKLSYNNSSSTLRKLNLTKIHKFNKNIDVENISNLNNDSIRSYLSKSKKNILSENNSKKEIIKSPDFQKTISREQIYKRINDKIPTIPFILPKYNLVRERIITKVIYEKPKENSPRIKYMKGLDSLINYNPDKVINKIGSHSEVKSPNFKYMSSRIDKKNCKLPSYMQGVHDRKSIDTINEKSLQLNNYSNSKYLNASNSFWPKKSYNNIINLNLLNNHFLNNDDYDEGFKSQREILKTSLSFFHKNYDEMIKEGALNKFDNITYKTIKRENKINMKEIDKYLINFEDEDDNKQ